MSNSRDYGMRKCDRKGCGKTFHAMTGNQKYCDAHKQSHKKSERTVSVSQQLLQLAASDVVSEDQRRVLVLLVAKHYS
jgi:hypothetical protein